MQKSKMETSKSQMKTETPKSQMKRETSKGQTKLDRATTSTASYTQMQMVSKTGRELSNSSGKTKSVPTSYTAKSKKPAGSVLVKPDFELEEKLIKKVKLNVV
uniref:Uncharacterized protein n=1 Tax=Romanomermis culicivorax TaxID=13658 RepID=A0A915JXX2_ROMCU